MVFAERRDSLLKFCIKNGIQAKIHYPIPIYKQKALKNISSKQSYKVTDFHAKNLISFPVDQHLEKKHFDYIYKIIKKFYE